MPMNKCISWGLLACCTLWGCTSPTTLTDDPHPTTPSTNYTMSTSRKVLFVLSSHKEKGNTGEKTGYYLSEAAHPWSVLTKAGYEVDFVSPQGGKAPVDGLDLDDPINKEFWENSSTRHAVEHTAIPNDITPSDYLAIHYVGGHGTMWDFPNNEALAQIATDIYEAGGAVSAVCHGPAGLVNIRLSDGSYLIDGKQVTGFTNEEEAAVKLTDVVPFLLEDRLVERGADFQHSGLWEQHVTVDGRLITGQNPASATGVGEALVTVLEGIPTE